MNINMNNTKRNPYLWHCRTLCAFLCGMLIFDSVYVSAFYAHPSLTNLPSSSSAGSPLSTLKATSASSDNCDTESSIAQQAMVEEVQNAQGIIQNQMAPDAQKGDNTKWDFSHLIDDCLSELNNMLNMNITDPLNMLINMLIALLMQICNVEVQAVNSTINTEVANAYGSIPGINALNHMNIGGHSFGALFPAPTVSASGSGAQGGINATMSSQSINNNFMPQNIQQSLNAQGNGAISGGYSANGVSSNGGSSPQAQTWGSLFVGSGSGGNTGTSFSTSTNSTGIFSSFTSGLKSGSGN